MGGGGGVVGFCLRLMIFEILVFRNTRSIRGNFAAIF